MLPITAEEKEHVTQYMASQAPDLRVTFVQKVYAENILGHVHAVWDIHTDKGRWWVVTNPTNLYSQEQFPNIDIAVTFHVGLCLRIPRSERPKLSDVSVEPFAACYRQISDAHDALSQAEEVGDFQAIGVRCREMLLAFTHAAQQVFPWASSEPKPKGAEFKAWAEHIGNVALPGASHEHRRHLLKTLLDAAWKFDSWLTHAKESTWHDAEAALSTTEIALTLGVSTALRLLRSAPDQCPSCGSTRLSGEHAQNPEDPDDLWERRSCQKCGWRGEATRSRPSRRPRKRRREPKAKSDCIIQPVPLRTLKRPS